jgi:predicted MFS family arabinose efflux permease
LITGTRNAPKLRGLLLSVTLTRTVTNTGFRMVYPFLPALARGLGVQPELLIAAVTARSTLMLTSPLLGSLGDLRGRRFAMVLGVIVFAVGLAPVTLWPSFATFVIAVLATGLSKALLDSAQAALLGDHIEFERRGTPMALVEASWSLAYLLGVPAIGLLISAFGWKSPFPILTALAVLSGLWMLRTIPRDRGRQPNQLKLAGTFAAILSRSSALTALAVALLIAMANEAVGIVYGLWMEGSFGLQIAALGAASALIGVSELGGEGLVAGISDRLGKRRAVSFGLAFSAAALLALPILARNLGGALLGLFLMYLSFEVSIVGMLPLMTEQVPQARSTLQATAVGAFSLGRALGALIGGPLFAKGIQANALVAAGLNLIALLLLLTLVDERGA